MSNSKAAVASWPPVQDAETGTIAEPVALARALARSEQVQAKVAACADDLAAVNDAVKTKLAEGATTVSAHTALASTQKVESKVRESADDLQEVNVALAQGLDDLEQTDNALTKSRKPWHRQRLP